MTLATVQDPIVISQFDVLLADITEAKAKAADVTFDYNTKEGNKAARSYIFDKRKLNARIESARTDAKAYALAYGRTVDSQAAELKQEVAALIKPHQEAIDAIAKAEADRVQRHRDAIQVIKDLAQVPFGSGANQIAMNLALAKAIAVDSLEEFKEEAAAALLEAIRTLEAAHAKALADEAAAAELEQLRELQRIQQEKDAEAERERKAQERADAAAIAAVEEAEQKVAEAQARADAAEAALAAAAVPVTVPVAPVVAKAAPAPQPLVQDPDPAGCSVMHHPARELLIKELRQAIQGLDRQEVCEAIANGDLHVAVCVNWGLFE